MDVKNIAVIIISLSAVRRAARTMLAVPPNCFTDRRADNLELNVVHFSNDMWLPS
jgi:hypothetical protein